jgi:hypothetical protein
MEIEELLYAVGLRRRNGNRPLAPHGTTAAYARHLNHGDEPCEPCREANNDLKRGQRDTAVPTPSKRGDIPHGTMRGYQRHQYRREQACEPCCEAMRAAGRARYRARKGGAL